MFILINIEVFNAMSTFESQISSYKRDTEFIILCFVNKVRILSFLHIHCIGVSFNQIYLSFVDTSIYENIELF